MLKRHNINNITQAEIDEKISAFDFVNWSYEPKESFKELCRQRAQQLRDTHDHIILSFSGGTDSTTVLNAFLDNNIHLDEVLIVAYDIDAPCLDGKKAVADLLNKHYSGIVNVVCIQYDQVLNYIKRKNVLEENPNFSGQLHAFMRYNTQYLERFGFSVPRPRHGKICHLYGESDPEVFILSEKPYARISLKHHFISSHDPMNTLFFTDPTFPQLYVKQAYVVARQLVKTPNMTHLQKKMMVRDFYSPQISPPKSSDDPKFIGQNLNLYSEPTILFNKFSEHEDFVEYYRRVHQPQFEISEKIMQLTVQNYKYHLLELGTETPSNK